MSIDSTCSNLLDVIDSLQEGQTLTENLCATNEDSGSTLVNLFFEIAAMRSRPEEDAANLFFKAFESDQLSALKILFWARDIRGGQGERRVFRTVLPYLANSSTPLLRANIHLIPEYGRWDDLFALFGTPLEGDALALIDSALTGSDAQPLCAKWMPREKSAKSGIARKIRKHMNLSPSAYRKLLSRLTKVVETDMCANNWDGIKYSSVPSVAMNVYRKAFERHSPERWSSYLNDLESGKETVNASVLYPHQVVKPLIEERYAYDMSPESDAPADNRLLEQQWKALPNYLLKNPHRILPVVDTSGSMYTGEGLQPIEVSVSLGLYIAERNNGPFKDHFITFSDTPSLQRLRGETLKERVTNLLCADWGMSTNIEAVFNLILSQAKGNDISEEDMPSMVLILSDMEFNQCATNYSMTAMQSIASKYAEAGYKIPSIIFWNLNARGNNFPVKFDEKGTALVSGFSPSILTHILSSGTITPIDVVNEVLESERYSLITKPS